MAMRQEQTALTQGVSFEHLLDAKKENLKKAVDVIVGHVKDGNYDELKALILAKKGSELFYMLEKEVRPLAEDAKIHKIGKDYSVHDCKVEEAETGVKYDYSVCGDSQWNLLNSQLVELETKKKEREAFLKTVTKSMTIVDEDTGDIHTITPPIRSGKLGLKITIK